MLFNSLVFLIFMAVFYSLWPLLRRRNNVRWIYIVIASFIFYGWWDYRFLFLIMFSGFIDYFAGLGMHHYPRRKKLLLILSLMGNIGSLAVFKYLDFGIQNLNWLLHLFHLSADIPQVHLILPVGISFYTFQSMSYTIDIYRGEFQPTRNVFHFFAYLAMFPQLVAGPIVRARELLPQLEQSHPISEQQRWEGLKLIVYGYFKKVVVADTLAPVVNAAFNASTPEDSCSYWWLIMIMFAYQIYCDFSGYSDIARGLGKWMGYEYPVNFDHPYIASSFREFWQRWHMSLSTWFRDYVYIPLGGSRKGNVHAHLFMWATMLISGLWHGAAWAFLAWAALHAFFLSFERLTNWPKKITRLAVVGPHLTTLIVFILTVVAWVFFRVGSCKLSATAQMGRAFDILGKMFNPAHLNPAVVDQLVDNAAINVLLLIFLRQLYFHFRLENKPWSILPAKQRRALEPVVLAILILTCVYMRGPGSAFIYFQF